jgi:D-serine deaminase-like pyridoxal phosphate-dependent protein
MKTEEIETPALVVDLDKFELNMKTMSQAARQYGIKLRPHAKAHKSPNIGLAQIAGGAIGICCQKVSEAEIFIDAGIKDVLLTNELVDPRKLDRLAALTRLATITVCVDHASQVRALSKAAVERKTEIGVLVEVDVGQRRCGTRPDASVVELARQIQASPGLQFLGLQAYHGTAQHMRSPDARRATIAEVAAIVRDVKTLLAEQGFQCTVIAGGGTGTFYLESQSTEFTEIQPGSYVFLDADYAKNEPEPAVPTFAQSLHVLTTVISIGAHGNPVLDAGYKALAVDSGLPSIADRKAFIAKMSDEHSVIQDNGTPSLQPGDRVVLTPSHIDPTVNLHDWYVGVRHGRVEVLWPIAARGPGL